MLVRHGSRFLLLATFVGVLFATVGAQVAHAAGPQDDLRDAGALVQQALRAARVGDLAAATSAYKAFENRWFDIEDGIRGVSRDSYRAIEAQMSQVNVALGSTPPNVQATAQALDALDAENQAFIAGRPPVATRTGGGTAPAVAAASADDDKPTVTMLLALLAATKTAAQSADWAGAARQFDTFGAIWTDVEGEIKTRSAADYRATEDDMARVATAIGAQAADTVVLVDRMTGRLQPYQSATTYSPFDATIIIFREGMEAMLVLVALLAFVKRSGNADKSSYIWWGAAAGLGASIALGVAINAILGKAFSGENREFMEGVTGLVAAAMLLYVSYWLHSKSSLGAWQHYIGDRTTRALATGSLYGLAGLSFLAVFREGGETVLFFLGMAGNITMSDLLIGLAIGAVLLAVIGFLLTVAGFRIPMRPFFQVASVLTFYLCFKFIGTGVHALQIADLLPATSSAALFASDTFGLYPTWESTLPQIALFMAGVGAWTRGVLADRAVRRESGDQEQPAHV